MRGFVLPAVAAIAALAVGGRASEAICGGVNDGIDTSGWVGPGEALVGDSGCTTGSPAAQSAGPEVAQFMVQTQQTVLGAGVPARIQPGDVPNVFKYRGCCARNDMSCAGPGDKTCTPRSDVASDGLDLNQATEPPSIANPKTDAWKSKYYCGSGGASSVMTTWLHDHIPNPETQKCERLVDTYGAREISTLDPDAQARKVLTTVVMYVLLPIEYIYLWARTTDNKFWTNFRDSHSGQTPAMTMSAVLGQALEGPGRNYALAMILWMLSTLVFTKPQFDVPFLTTMTFSISSLINADLNAISDNNKALEELETDPCSQTEPSAFTCGHYKWFFEDCILDETPAFRATPKTEGYRYFCPMLGKCVRECSLGCVEKNQLSHRNPVNHEEIRKIAKKINMQVDEKGKWENNGVLTLAELVSALETPMDRSGTNDNYVKHFVSFRFDRPEKCDDKNIPDKTKGSLLLAVDPSPDTCVTLDSCSGDKYLCPGVKLLHKCFKWSATAGVSDEDEDCQDQKSIYARPDIKPWKVSAQDERDDAELLEAIQGASQLVSPGKQQKGLVVPDQQGLVEPTCEQLDLALLLAKEHEKMDVPAPNACVDSCLTGCKMFPTERTDPAPTGSIVETDKHYCDRLAPKTCLNQGLFFCGFPSADDREKRVPECVDTCNDCNPGTASGTTVKGGESGHYMGLECSLRGKKPSFPFSEPPIEANMCVNDCAECLREETLKKQGEGMNYVAMIQFDDRRSMCMDLNGDAEKLEKKLVGKKDPLCDDLVAKAAQSSPLMQGPNGYTDSTSYYMTKSDDNTKIKPLGDKSDGKEVDVTRVVCRPASEQVCDGLAEGDEIDASFCPDLKVTTYFVPRTFQGCAIKKKEDTKKCGSCESRQFTCPQWCYRLKKVGDCDKVVVDPSEPNPKRFCEGHYYMAQPAPAAYRCSVPVPSATGGSLSEKVTHCSEPELAKLDATKLQSLKVTNDNLLKCDAEQLKEKCRHVVNGVKGHPMNLVHTCEEVKSVKKEKDAEGKINDDKIKSITMCENYYSVKAMKKCTYDEKTKEGYCSDSKDDVPDVPGCKDIIEAETKTAGFKCVSSCSDCEFFTSGCAATQTCMRSCAGCTGQSAGDYILHYLSFTTYVGRSNRHNELEGDTCR